MFFGIYFLILALVAASVYTLAIILPYHIFFIVITGIVIGGVLMPSIFDSFRKKKYGNILVDSFCGIAVFTFINLPVLNSGFFS